MPVFLASLGGMFLNLAGSLVGQVLVALGLSLVTYTGVDMALDKLKSDAVTALLGLPPDLVALLSFMKVGVAISIVTSAVAVRMGLDGMSGVVKRLRRQ
ncbi:hypothetical protein GCM10010975_37590 [Comamonas phosphati]|nr:hypothetical protein GCM10010975_37590 [Comamonas phosphati]